MDLPARSLSLPLLAPIALACALAACGGGSSDGGDSTAAATPTPAAATPASAPGAGGSPVPAPTPEPSPGNRATCNLADFQSEILARVNARRSAGADCGTAGRFAATTPLAWNAPLTQAALAHSDDMAAGNFFDHTGSDGSSAGARATAAGYVWRAWGENIAAGQTSVQQVVQGWMASPGHCANIMEPRFADIGVACVRGSASNTYRTYWTMTLGAAR